MVEQLMLPFAGVEMKPMPLRQEEDAYLRYHEVIKLIGVPVHKTTLWRWEQKNAFPKRIKRGEKTIVWLKSEIVAWDRARRAERHQAQKYPC